MALQPGTKAPEFTLTSLTADGPKHISLTDALAEGPVVLYFFPMAFTGGCTKEFCEITDSLTKYSDLNAQVLGISGDNPFAQAEWAKAEKIEVSLLSDYEHDVTKAYDVAYDTFLPDKNLSMGGVAKRSAFVVDSNGVIQYSESSDDPSVLPDFDKIQAKLKELI